MARLARTELAVARARSRTFTVSLWFSRRTQPRTPRAYNGRHLTVAACGGAFEKGFAMLDELHVQNVALIREATFAPAQGLTVVTGETGAGKTALLSGNQAACGRARRRLYRA